MFYWLALIFIRFVGLSTVRLRTHGLARGRAPGGYLLAVAHVSHLDAFWLGSIWPRKVGWMARVEFYHRLWAAWCMRRLHAFPVRRQGVPVRAVREALARLKRGEVVGVFPEGEIKAGRESALRGGSIKRGVCLLAARSGRPVLPCVIVGADKLLRVEPYLPFRRGRLWVLCGEFIPPVSGPDRRAARAEMAARLERAYVQLFQELRERWALEDTIAP